MRRYGSLININPSGRKETGEQQDTTLLITLIALLTSDRGQYFVRRKLCNNRRIMYIYSSNKTEVSNDPLGQTHSLASSEHCFRLKFVLF